jgi:hypothetical protein
MLEASIPNPWSISVTLTFVLDVPRGWYERVEVEMSLNVQMTPLRLETDNQALTSPVERLPAASGSKARFEQHYSGIGPAQTVSQILEKVSADMSSMTEAVTKSLANADALTPGDLLRTQLNVSIWASNNVIVSGCAGSVKDSAQSLLQSGGS